MQVLHKMFNPDRTQQTLVGITAGGKFTAVSLVKNNDFWEVAGSLDFKTQAEAEDQASQWSTLIWIPTAVKALMIMVFALWASVSQARLVNPDGYVGAVTTVLDAGIIPQQGFNNSTDYLGLSDSSSYEDSYSLHKFYTKQYGYTLDVQIKYPVNESFTFGFGVNWQQNFIHTKEDFASYIVRPSINNTYYSDNRWAGSTEYDDNHGIYTFKVHCVYYWGAPKMDFY